MPRRANWLSDMEIDEVSLVDRTANQLSHVAIAKRATEEVEVPDIYNANGELLDVSSLALGDVVYDEQGNAYVVDDGDEEIQGDLEEKKEPELVGKSFSDSIRTELSKALTDIERDEVIAKALGAVEQAERRATEAEKIAKSERELRLEREYIAKAAEYNVPVEAESLGPVLMRMAETMSYDDCAVIHKALTSAGQIIFDEVGFMGGADNVDVMSQVNATVEETVAKAAGSNQAEEIAKFFSNNPRAYDEYLAERR